MQPNVRGEGGADDAPKIPESERSSSATLIEIQGEDHVVCRVPRQVVWDIQETPEVVRAVESLARSPGVKILTVDLSNVRSMMSATLGWLNARRRQMEKLGKKLLLSNESPEVMNELLVTKFYKLFHAEVESPPEEGSQESTEQSP